jgi:hypothetical protein
MEIEQNLHQNLGRSDTAGGDRPAEALKLAARRRVAASSRLIYLDSLCSAGKR